MARQNLPSAVERAATIRGLLEKSRRQFEMALPKHLTADRLLRVAMTSIQRTPKLLECTPQSLLACIMTCAQLGLEPDQFLGQAYLVPFKDNKKDVVTCTLIPGYRGYISLARRSGEVQSISSQAVYEKDGFALQYGIEEKLEHIPYEPSEAELDTKEPRGAFKGAYVIFKYKDGSYSFDYMGKAEIDRIRKRSKAANDGPWVTDYAEMAKKTVIKRHAKLAPLSVEFQRAVALEDRAMSGESQADLLGMYDADGTVIDVDAAPDPAQIASDFDATIPEGTDRALLEEFLTRTATGNKTSVDDVKAGAIKDPKGFWRFFAAWVKQRTAAQETSQDTKAEEAVSRPPWDIGLAPAECPNKPGSTMTRKFCDDCKERPGCPVWK